MYASQINGRDLTFGVSGMLWRRSLVMYDKETNSYWSHILGRAMDGELVGTKLNQVPSVMTDWRTWKRDHPDTSVLWMDRTAQRFRLEYYRDPARFVLAIVDGGTAAAWSLDRLKSQPIQNTRLQDVPVVVTFDDGSVTARLFRRRVGDRTLTFRAADGRMVDLETRTSWNPQTGVAVEGELAGAKLVELPAFLSFQKTWEVFHPGSVHPEPEPDPQ